jgi:hypothetical protein
MSYVVEFSDLVTPMATGVITCGKAPIPAHSDTSVNARGLVVHLEISLHHPRQDEARESHFVSPS